MKRAFRIGARLAVLVGLSLAIPTPAAAYVGPGAVLAVVGAAVAVVGAVFVTVGGFVWYPVKRVLKALGRGEEESPPDE